MKHTFTKQNFRLIHLLLLIFQFGYTQELFINEIHYDNAGADSDEGIELAGPANLDLTDYKIVLYNGNGGTVYNTVMLTGLLPEIIEGYGFLSIPIRGLQNGSPDGIALVNDKDQVLQFLSYEGSLTAVEGPANGLTSTDIGIAEASNTPIGTSLQLTGIGKTYEDFEWESGIQSFGSQNQKQSFGDDVDPIEIELKTIAEARLLPLGTQVKVRGVLTVSDQFGGPAYLQDETAGIAIFDNQIQANSLFTIGDAIEVTASVSEFRGMIQLSSVTKVERITTDLTVEPLEITLSEISNLEGQLVRVNDITFDVKGRLNVGNHQINDATASLTIRIDNSVDSLIGRVKPTEPSTITGVVGSFNGAFQILPRFLADIPDSKEFILQPPAGEDIPRSKTLDVATWNLEFFGATQSGFGPSDTELQKQNVLKVLDSLRADIIAVQEVSDKEFLTSAIATYGDGNFAVICSDVFSRSFEQNNDDFPPQQLCFIYNTQNIKVLNERVIFETFYTNARTGITEDLSDYPTGNPRSFWSSGRLPYLIEVETNFNQVTDTLQIINVHAKSGRSAEDVARKAYDFSVLKDTLDTYYSTGKLILLGDYNDDVDVSIGGGPTPILPFVTDTTNFDIVSDSFSFDGLSTTVGFGSVIDHTAISNELFGPYIEDSENLIDPQSYIMDYGTTTSDHFPTVTRLLFTKPVPPLKVTLPETVTLFRGYQPLSEQKVTAAVSGGKAPYTYLWSTGNISASQLIKTNASSTISVTVTDADNTSVTKKITVEVEDVTCNKLWFTGVQMCFKNRTVCVPDFVVPYLLHKGYSLGICNNNAVINKKSTIIAPNPFSTQLGLQFDFSLSTESIIKIYSYSGALIYEQKYTILTDQPDLTIDTAKFKRGFYVIKIYNLTTGEVLKSQTVIKI